MSFEFRIQKSFSRQGYDIWVFRRVNGKTAVAKPLTIELGEPQSDVFLLPEPTLYLRNDDYESLAASLKKELVGNGWLPHAEMLEGELKATKLHLGDMQKLVFKDFK
jgi:hypothetical protein